MNNKPTLMNERNPLIMSALLEILLSSALFIFGYFAAGAALQQPNIVWLNCEDLDDILGCYGDNFATTPNLDELAKESIVFKNAFANAPICAPARNCLITGMYPTSIGGQHLRCEIELPNGIKPFPSILKQSGYFVTNYSKTDYNFSPDGIYDYWKKDMSPWRHRKDLNKPFFSFFVFGATHEGPANFTSRYESTVTSLSEEKLHSPEKVTLPPYFPNTKKMRQLWARYYDLAAAMDEQVGQIINNLKNDNLWENTIIWFFSDHGHGLPRHKRWLLDSGIRVPFMVRIPEKYKHLANGFKPGSEYSAPVSFVDFAPTVLSQANIKIPGNMQGRAFLGAKPEKAREYVFASRDRADDMFEVSRAVHDGRYIYIRHFLSHLPYIQGGRIFGNQKESLAELRRAKANGLLDQNSSKLFSKTKPKEEFYDLKTDPYELNNLAEDPKHKPRIDAMRAILIDWIIKHRDTGFLSESDYTRRAKKVNLSIYEMARDNHLYDLPSIVRTALGENIEGKDDGILYQKIIQRNLPNNKEALLAAMEHKNPSIAVSAAELACQRNLSEQGLKILIKHLKSEDKILKLEAARALFNVGIVAKPAIEEVRKIRKSLEGNHPKRVYKDFNYASFTGWALEGVLVNCGVATYSQFEK